MSRLYDSYPFGFDSGTINISKTVKKFELKNAAEKIVAFVAALQATILSLCCLPNA